MNIVRNLAAMAFTLAFANITIADDHGYGYDEKQRVNLLWLINGTKNSYTCEIPPTELGTIEATCHDHDIINLKTGRIIGTATDATADVMQIGEGLVGTGTTFFYLPQGTLVVRGTGTIQPTLHGNPQQDRHAVTHIAGIFPEPDANNVLSGTGVFEGTEGTFVLLGALDLTNAAQGQGSYHCVYDIDLEMDRRRAKHWKHRSPKNPRLN
jgi:hypothetical protein